MVNFNMGEADTALQYYEQAMVLTEQNNNMIERIQLLIHIGGAYHMLERYSDALDVYLQALPLTEKYQRIGDRSICLYNIGLAYVYLNQLEKAIQFFEESIELKEKLRLSATGQDRLDYLAAEVHVYQWLSLTHLQMDNYEMAITVIENSSAKYLKEQLQYRASTALVFPGIDAVQKNLKQDELLINYASNSTPWNSVMTISSSELDGVLLFPDDLGNQFSYNAVSEFTRLTGMHRGISLLFQEESVTEIGQMSFDDIINYYRLLLISKTNPEQLYKTGRYLYDYFIAPLESQISGHKNLTIIPDGILAFLPFETLIMPDGRYLVEEYNISYVQSLAVSEIISRRTYSEDRMDFIGFGGANYDKFSNRTKPTDYSSLNISGWNNLPGTVLEINEISSLYESSNIFQKNDLSELAIKNLSKNGTLKQYKIIHFATHGLVLPEQPELSALVLTSYGKQSEDGYLNVAEISRLDIAADFVNLSACETGLGKIYGGEGVVGLAQAFLIAGANSLSVSLWQVADQSTREFMVGFYKLITSGEFTYNHAMSEMKREFIASEQYNHPFYWAPFVFYGE
jgi:CHAT domain-containing protein